MRRTLIPLVAAIFLGGAALPATALASEKAIWGPAQLPSGASAFPLYRSLGVDNYQESLAWSAVAQQRPANPRNPADPAYHWPATTDFVVSQARRFGIKVTLLVSQTPGWANGGKPSQWAPTNVRDYANFLIAASRRYRSVRRWMIWGEPTRHEMFEPLPNNRRSGPRLYAKLLDAAYGALKRRSRRNIVIGGNTFTAGDVVPRDFIRWMRLPNGKPPRLDWFGHNPFSTRFPDLRLGLTGDGNRDFGTLDTYHREICRAYRKIHRCPKLWLSEFTIQSDHGSSSFNFFVSRKVQARWLKAAYRIAARNRWIAGLGWFQLLDEPRAPFNAQWGLMTYEGKRKPAFFAYKRAKGARR